MRTKQTNEIGVRFVTLYHFSLLIARSLHVCERVLSVQALPMWPPSKYHFCIKTIQSNTAKCQRQNMNALATWQKRMNDEKKKLYEKTKSNQMKRNGKNDRRAAKTRKKNQNVIVEDERRKATKSSERSERKKCNRKTFLFLFFFAPFFFFVFFFLYSKFYYYGHPLKTFSRQIEIIINANALLFSRYFLASGCKWSSWYCRRHEDDR